TKLPKKSSQRSSQMHIRKYTPSDCIHFARLFYDTVHTVNAQDYAPEQLDAWADGNVDLEAWDRSFLEHYTVAATENGAIVGFGDIDSTGYLDRLYVHKDFLRRGIASAICDELESAVGADRIVTHASITAKPFFLRRGYVVIKEQQVVRKGISLTNYVMEKAVILSRI
ncbi:MAG: GNAT family N-acetyltransferase, partial [Oscillospiraceae bacterium]